LQEEDVCENEHIAKIIMEDDQIFLYLECCLFKILKPKMDDVALDYLVVHLYHYFVPLEDTLQEH